MGCPALRGSNARVPSSLWSAASLSRVHVHGGDRLVPPCNLRWGGEHQYREVTQTMPDDTAFDVHALMQWETDGGLVPPERAERPPAPAEGRGEEPAQGPRDYL